MQNHRNEALRRVDTFSHDLLSSSQYPAIAARDLGRLAALAKAVIDDLDGWGDRLATLNCAVTYERARAALLVMESVFDEVLEPDACRVLSAEMDLLIQHKR